VLDGESRYSSSVVYGAVLCGERWVGSGVGMEVATLRGTGLRSPVDGVRLIPRPTKGVGNLER
jgi:hypothetical protein